jgi:hypothetical protein
MKQVIEVNAEDLPLTIKFKGADGKERAYEMIKTRKGKGAQLC